MATDYQYNISKVIERNLVECQADKLFKDGFQFNDKLGTWEKYDLRYEEVTYIDVRYYETEDVEVSESLYEIQEIDSNIYRVSYIDKSRQGGFLGFFRKLFAIRSREDNVTDERFDELIGMQAEGLISDLEKTITPTVRKKQVRYTDRESFQYFESGKPIKLIKKGVGSRIVERQIEKEITLKQEQYDDFMEDKELIDKNTRTVKEQTDKILVDIREEVEYNSEIYLPGVWSRKGNHSKGTVANFIVTTQIKYISGFSPLDPECLDFNKLKEEAKEIITQEHPNAIHIDRRLDNRDGFEIEKVKIG